jgi:hypothetical protein
MDTSGRLYKDELASGFSIKYQKYFLLDGSLGYTG